MSNLKKKLKQKLKPKIKSGRGGGLVESSVENSIEESLVEEGLVEEGLVEEDLIEEGLSRDKQIIKKHYCYLLRNKHEPDKNRTYNGYTVDPVHRIRQHNQEIKGGAIYTKKYGARTWEIYALLKGFPDKHNAQQCEWRIKHPAKKRIRPNRYNSPAGRIVGLNEILKLEKWTNNSTIHVNDLNLDLFIVKEFEHLLTDIPPNINVNSVDRIDLKELLEDAKS